VDHLHGLITTLNGKIGKYSMSFLCLDASKMYVVFCLHDLIIHILFINTNCSPKYEKEFGCRKQLMDEKYTSKHPIRKDSDTWKLLLEQNRFDLHLYDFAKELYSQQSYIFGL
jgi:hypothetical protein